MSKEMDKTSICLGKWHKGDEQALEELINHHLPWLHEQVHKRLGPILRSKGETVDYVQDAMVQFIRYGPRFTLSSDAQFRALLLRIVENSLRNQYDWFTAKRREIARDRPLPPDSMLCLDAPRGEVRTPSKSAQRLEREAWIRLGIELLDPASREILILHLWDDLPFTEIGARLGITQEAARMRHNRAALRLAEKIWALRSGKLDQIDDDVPPGGGD